MRVRLRLPELFEEHKTTAYRVVKASGGRLDAGTLYRLIRNKGRVQSFRGELLEALCDVLGIADPGTLLERESTATRKAKRRGKR